MGPEDVLTHWFGALTGPEDCHQEKYKLWFQSTPEQDDALRAKFGALHAQAARGELSTWEETARGRLALVILLDQMSRNLFRGTAQAFAQDELAFMLAREGVARGHDQELWPLERAFLYMPYEHREELEAQEQCVALMEALANVAEGEAGKVCQGYVRYAHHHREIVERFGRFPHRNEVLGRAPTEEERAYLSEGGARFGQ